MLIAEIIGLDQKLDKIKASGFILEAFLFSTTNMEMAHVRAKRNSRDEEG
ncbi:MAG: hypothetical protein AAF902_04975 [Chloroflexota bacterium]